MRTSTVIRQGSALVGVAGALLLAGCATASGDVASSPNSSSEKSDAGAKDYVDGTYSAEDSYQTPETVESVDVTITLADGVVTDVKVEGDPQTPESKQYQSQFIKGIADQVVGVPIDDLNVSRVAGSSLTSGGFNAALESIKEQAAA